MRMLRTSRLRLVPVTPANAGVLWNVLQQPDLRKYQDLPNVTAATFAEMVGKRPRVLQPGASGRFEWLVYALRVRRPVGWVSLRIAASDVYSGEVGYSIVREFRGRGIATEALRLLVDEAFERGALTTLGAYCVPENAASRRVLENAGFVRDGVMPHGATVSGQPVDVLTHRFDRERWHQRGNSMVIPASGYPA